MPTASFVNHIETLATQAAAQAAAAVIPGVLVRPWQIPYGYSSGDPIGSPEGLKAACDRTDLNEMAAAAYQTGAGPNAGRIGTIVAAKKAIDHIATYERSLQARHASPVRLRAWASARRAGHGYLPYGVFGAFAADVNGTADAATVIDNAQT